MAIGVKPADLLTHARLPTSLSRSEVASLTTEQYFALWNSLGVLSDDEASGIMLAERVEPSWLPPAFLAAMYARDFRNALALVARFKSLCSHETVALSEHDDVCVVDLTWLEIDLPVPAALVDAAFAAFLKLGRDGTGHHLQPRRVELMHTDRFGSRKKYFGCAVRTSAARNRLVFARDDLDRTFRPHNPEMLALLEPELTARLENEQTALSISAQVKRTIKRQIAGAAPDVQMIARELGLSPRTLQRRIGEEGATFRDLLGEARRELIKLYLRDPAIDVAEVAYLVGYDDPGSFYRAFRDWAGMTPARWRAGMVQGAA